MLQQLLLQKLLAQKLKDVPQQERQAIMESIEKNPELFMTLAGEIEAKTKSGMNQMDAARGVFETHQEELKQLLG